MDKVLKTFAAPIRIRVGQIVDADGWRNVGFLRRRGYLQPIEGVEADPVEEPVKRSRARQAPVEAVPEVQEVIVPAEMETEKAAEVDVPVSLSGSPLEQVAAATIADPVHIPDELASPAPTPNFSKMTKAQLVAHAESIGVKVVPDTMTNKQIIEAIEEV